jgi:hypothetical protein
MGSAEGACLQRVCPPSRGSCGVWSPERWTLSQRSFGAASIGHTQRQCDDLHLESWEDHRVWYCAGRVRAALVSQPYGKIKDYRDELDESAAQHGLQWHLAPNPYASFHYPGRTLFIVVTMPGVEVKWLPEQARDEGKAGVTTGRRP